MAKVVAVDLFRPAQNHVSQEGYCYKLVSAGRGKYRRVDETGSARCQTKGRRSLSKGVGCQRLHRRRRECTGRVDGCTGEGEDLYRQGQDCTGEGEVVNHSTTRKGESSQVTAK